MFEQLKTGSVLTSLKTGVMLKITKANKPITAQSMLVVAHADAQGKAVRGTAKEMKADSLRRRYSLM